MATRLPFLYNSPAAVPEMAEIRECSGHWQQKNAVVRGRGATTVPLLVAGRLFGAATCGRQLLSPPFSVKKLKKTITLTRNFIFFQTSTMQTTIQDGFWVSGLSVSAPVQTKRMLVE